LENFVGLRREEEFCEYLNSITNNLQRCLNLAPTK